MWLLGTQTLKLHNFITDVPEYVILSHTWGAQEVSFDDMKDPLVRRGLKGFDKIVGCCQQARQDGFEWAWIDTCCIDKRSSAELSEAINSMYNWYWHAAKCYAYLSDVPDLRDFKSASWFERGWTLQELLAPAIVEFYDSEWSFLGTKMGLVYAITETTGIDVAYIVKRYHIRYASVATRFSWASKRSTTRVEDTAYCLLGLMRVNMPMLYGEGEKAFFRLQLELLKKSNEHTIFAWGAFHSVDIAILEDEASALSVLAPSPAWFRHSAGVRSTGPRVIGKASTHEVTNSGLRITLPITWEEAWLQCQDTHQNIIGIRLQEQFVGGQHCRVGAEMIVRDPDQDSGSDRVMDMHLQVEDHEKLETRSSLNPPTALRVNRIHTYRECDVQLVSVSDDEGVTTANNMVDNSITSTIDANYIVNEFVLSEHAVACLSLSTKISQSHMLILLSFQNFEPLIFAVERLPHMTKAKDWYMALLDAPYERESYFRDRLVVGGEDFQHIVTAKVVKEGTRLTWSITIVAAKDVNRNDFYGSFGSLKGKHQEKNLACFCIDCRVVRLKTSSKAILRWQTEETLASAQRQQQKQRSDTGVGHVLECTCHACARESFIEVNPPVGAPQPHFPCPSIGIGSASWDEILPKSRQIGKPRSRGSQSSAFSFGTFSSIIITN